MELDTSTWMMFFFIISLVLSIWKIWDFLPNKQLEDDDTTEASQEELIKVMLKVIQEKGKDLKSEELFLLMQKDESFDSKLFWRFNLNKLNHLLSSYYLQHPQMSSIEDIYKELNEKQNPA